MTSRTRFGKIPAHSDLAEANALIQHLQVTGEIGRASAARKLHDDIAGLMTAALMDLTAAAAHLPSHDEKAQEELARAKSALHLAIDHSRRLVEELRPTLLDNFGLFTALKWRVQQARKGSTILYTEVYPEAEPPLSTDALIALFRIAEEALAMTLKRGDVNVADLEVSVDEDGLHMRMTDNGIPVMLEGQELGAALALSSMRYRLRLLGGSVDIERNETGETVLTASMPL